MKLVIAKTAISAYLLYVAYSYLSQDLLMGMLKESVAANIERLPIDQRSKEFLRLYLINAIMFTFLSSVLTVVTRSVLPKMFNVVGILLFLYFSVHPDMMPQRFLQRMMEDVCLAGGMLLIAGSEYVSSGLSLKMESPMWEEGKEDKKREQR